MEIFTHTTADGASLSFAHLSLYDIFGDPKLKEVNGFVPIYRQQLKAELLANLKLSEFDKGQIAIELNGFDKHHKRRNPMDAFIEFIKESLEAMKEIVKRSFAVANPADAMPVIPSDEMVDLCWKLLEPFGIVQTPAEESGGGKAGDISTYGDGGADSPNQTAPETYSATPIVMTGAQIGLPPNAESSTPLAK